MLEVNDGGHGAELTVIKRLVYRSMHCDHGPFAFQAPSINGSIMTIIEIGEITLNFGLGDYALIVLIVILREIIKQ